MRALLTREGIQLPKLSDIFRKKGMEFLKGIKLQQQRRMALDNYMKVLEVLSCVIKEVENTLEEKAEVTEEAKWLMSTPGIGFHNALLILSELGEIERFERLMSFVCYAGLALNVEQSGEQVRVRYGHINRHSNGFLR